MTLQECKYCSEKIEYQPHFACHICNAGMCNNCYDMDTEHDRHFNKPLENVEDKKLYKYILAHTNQTEPEYLCEECFEKLSREYKGL